MRRVDEPDSIRQPVNPFDKLRTIVRYSRNATTERDAVASKK